MKHWVTADIHGAFSILWNELLQAGFNPATDILYSLGDLVNRGSESVAAYQWLMKPWFKPVRGNHEAMIIQSFANPDNRDTQTLLRQTNGQWWFDLSETARTKLASGLDSLPYTRSLIVGERRIGLVHADVPEGMSWPDFCEATLAGDESARHAALWSRARWLASIGSGFTGEELPRVTGVDWVFVGHSPVEQPTIVGNVVFLDCGLWKGNRQGVICIQDWLQDNDPVAPT